MNAAVLLPALLAAACIATSAETCGHQTKSDERLPIIGDAPDFALIDQDGARFALHDVRGKVVAVTFIYATCTDTCPLLTAKLASLQKPLGGDFGTRVRFVSVTVDPEVDTPAILRDYAKGYGANLAGWSFLTGTRVAIDDVVHSFGAYAKRTGRGRVDHLFLTSLIDRQGKVRVQYVGYRFKPEEMLSDLRALLSE